MTKYTETQMQKVSEICKITSIHKLRMPYLNDQADIDYKQEVRHWVIGRQGADGYFRTEEKIPGLEEEDHILFKDGEIQGKVKKL